MRSSLVCLVAGCVALAGCASSNSGLPPVAYDPAGGVEQAFSSYDVNKDGFLTADELIACPGLRGALPNIDQDKDRKISRDELQKRLEQYATSGVSAFALTCTVQLNGKPLEGAVVTFTPEPFVGPGVKPATGTTGADGVALPAVEGQGVAGLAFGVYKVTVSKLDPSGAETLPPQYNTKSTLGREVGPDDRGSYQLQLSGGR